MILLLDQQPKIDPSRLCQAEQYRLMSLSQTMSTSPTIFSKSPGQSRILAESNRGHMSVLPVDLLSAPLHPISKESRDSQRKTVLGVSRTRKCSEQPERHTPFA